MKSHQAAYTSIGIIGGGFVGITLAAHLLENPENRVTVFEQSPEKANLFQLGNYQVQEPELDEILNLARQEGRLGFNEESTEELDSIFICVGTPKDLTRVEQLQVFESILVTHKKNLKHGGFVFLRSTVALGTTDALAEFSSKSDRDDISIFFAPERTAEGNAIHELRTLPQVIGSTKISGNEGTEFLEHLGFNVITCSDAKGAELVKLACNTWRDTIFAYANELAMIADSVGVDAHEVISVANQGYIRGGIPRPGPVGGPCLTKDSHILLEDSSDKDGSMILTGRLLNESLIRKVADYLYQQSRNSPNYCLQIIGAAFKGNPFTNDVRDGVADQLMTILESQYGSNIRVQITDETLQASDLLNLQQYWSPSEYLEKPHAVIIGHDGAWVVNKQNQDYLRSLGSETLIIDLWGVTRAMEKLSAEVRRFGSGMFL
jgi:nucleotide sugar dehydrogenase